MRQLLSASVCGVSLLFLTVVSAGATTRTVCASGCAYTDLQSAIDAAVFGDTILLRAGQTFVDITLDRSHVDGDRYKGQKRGITLSGRRLGVLNRYSSDIKAVDVDSQAIIGYNGPASVRSTAIHESVRLRSFLMVTAACRVASASTTMTVRWRPNSSESCDRGKQVMRWGLADRVLDLGQLMKSVVR